MRWSSRASLLLACALAAAAGARAQQPAREIQVQALGVASRPLFGGAGVGYAWRDPRRGRWQLQVTGGVLDGRGAAARTDLAWHFLLDPAKRRGSAVYGGAGLSALAGDGRVKPYVLLVLGAENAPGGTGGSFVEIGVGGGVRVSAGYRWRKRHAPGR